MTSHPEHPAAAAVHARTIRTLLPGHLTPDEQDLLAQALTRVTESGQASPLAQEDPWHNQPHSA